MKLLKLILTFGFISLISACGGGGSSAPAKAADITADNAQKLSIAATESTRQAVNTDAANFLNLSSFQPKMQSFSEKLTQQIQRSSDLAIDLGIVCSTGNYTPNISANSLNGSITFNGCAISSIDGTIILSGTVKITASNTSFSLSYNDFSISYNGVTEIVNFTMKCKSTASSFSCSTSSSFTGIDDRTYSVSNISVSSDVNSAFTVSADVTDPDFGKITISAQSVTFNCANAKPSNDRPSSGSITFSSNDKSASITFDSCYSYTVTVDGSVANTYQWYPEQFLDEI